jgi:hypothetical protein
VSFVSCLSVALAVFPLAGRAACNHTEIFLQTDHPRHRQGFPHTREAFLPSL